MGFEILYWGILLKFVSIFRFWLKSDNNSTLNEDLYAFLCAQMTAHRIPTQVLHMQTHNHMREPIAMMSLHRQTHMEMSITQDNSDVTATLKMSVCSRRKSQFYHRLQNSCLLCTTLNKHNGDDIYFFDYI
jgi:hypothetical protein